MVTDVFIGKRIRVARLEKGFSQTFLAEALGTIQSLVSMLETGKRPVSIDLLTLLCQFLEKPPSYFLQESVAQVSDSQVGSFLEQVSQEPELVPDLLRHARFLQFRRQINVS